MEAVNHPEGFYTEVWAYLPYVAKVQLRVVLYLKEGQLLQGCLKSDWKTDSQGGARFEPVIYTYHNDEWILTKREEG